MSAILHRQGIKSRKHLLRQKPKEPSSKTTGPPAQLNWKTPPDPQAQNAGDSPGPQLGKTYGALAQLVARNVRIVEVRGSNPLCSIAKKGLRQIASSPFYAFEGTASVYHFGSRQGAGQRNGLWRHENSNGQRPGSGKIHQPPADRTAGVLRQIPESRCR